MIAAIETILIFRYLHGLSEYGQATGKTITPFVLPIVFAEAENSNGLLKVLIDVYKRQSLHRCKAISCDYCSNSSITDCKCMGIGNDRITI